MIGVDFQPFGHVAPHGLVIAMALRQHHGNQDESIRIVRVETDPLDHHFKRPVDFITGA